jgi:hypothetical protein
VRPAVSQTLSTIELLPSLTAYVSLVPGPSGTFYGVTADGNLGFCNFGCGKVFQLTPTTGGWTQTTLHVFTGADGIWPAAGLLLDQSGNLFGTTYYGGTSQACLGLGCGVVFELSPDSDGHWTETTLYSFSGGVDGQSPTSIVLGPSGSLLGTTVFGGASTNCGTNGCGVLYQVLKGSNGQWQERVLSSFVGGVSGQNPVGIVENSSGVIYGAASGGVVEDACAGNYCGTLFRFTQTSGVWKETVLHTFHGNDGANPNGSLTIDSSGHIFGTTQWGGNVCRAPGCGVVFELALTNGAWKESVLHFFANGTDGQYPSGGLVFDAKGNLYGGTSNGGAVTGCNPFESGYCGQIFRLSPGSTGWHVSALYPTPAFYVPVGDLVFDSSGNLFGASCDEYYFLGGNIFTIAK